MSVMIVYLQKLLLFVGRLSFHTLGITYGVILTSFLEICSLPYGMENQKGLVDLKTIFLLIIDFHSA